MGIIESTEDQYDREQKRHIKNFEVGDMVAAILHPNGNTRLRIKRVLNTEVEGVKLYECETADHSIVYATKAFIWHVR